MMQEKCSCLLDLVHKRLSLAKNFEPRMFVSDHFSSLRNEIDLETETRLIELEEKPSEMGKEQSREQAWDQNAYNSARQSMIDELKLQESELIGSLKQPSEFEAFAQSLLRMEEKMREIEAAVVGRRENDWSNLKKLTRVYLEIEDLLDVFRSKALNNKTFIFKTDFLNPLGALIVFEDVYLNEAESMFIKNSKDTQNCFSLNSVFKAIEKHRDNGLHFLSYRALVDRKINKSKIIASHFSNIIKSSQEQFAKKTLLKIYQRPSQTSTEITIENEASILAQFLCIVKSLEICASMIHSIEQNSFEYCKNLKTLSISLNHLEHLEKKVFIGLENLNFLTLTTDSIETIDANCFDDLKSLTELSLESNNIRHLTPGQFSSLTKLNHLFLHRNKISWSRANRSTDLSTENASPFYNMNNLTELDLTSNRLSNVDGLFDGLPSLKILNLVSNQLDELTDCLLNPGKMETSLETLRLDSNLLRSIKPDAFRNLGKLRDLHLSGNRLLHIQESIKFLCNLEELVLKSNRIQEIDVGSLRTLVNLTRLDLSMNRISALQENVFEVLSNLETLILSNNLISKLSPDHFKGLGELSNLNLSHNLISFEPEDSNDLFRHLVSLKELTLTHNYITTIKRTLFGPSLKDLTSLRLSDNQIAEIEDSAFVNLKNLTFLILDSNRLISVSTNMFQGLDELMSLFMNKNLITILPDYAFINLLKLTNLVLAHNLIESIGPNAFNCLFNVHYLNLSSNRIVRLEDRVFECLSKLSDLYLSSNQIEAIGSDALSGLTNLTTVNLSINRLESLPERVFEQTPKLQTLILSKNRLRRLDLKSLSHLKSLDKLDVCSNRIEALDDDPNEYASIATLSHLNLDDNPIRFVRPDSFSCLDSLRQLNMSRNELDGLGELVIDSLFSLESLALNSSNLRSIRIVKNNFRKCQNIGIRSLSLSEHKIRRLDSNHFQQIFELSELDLSANKLVEIGSDDLRSLTSLRVLLLNSNRIREIHSLAFKTTSELSMINLSGNSLRCFGINALANLKSLHTLNLADNLITRISDVFRCKDLDCEPEFLPPDFSAYSFNQSDCDLDLNKRRIFKDFRALILSTNFIRDLSDIQAVQKSTNNCNLFASVDDLVLDKNFITAFRPETEWTHFSSLTKISLSYNELERLECFHEDSNDDKWTPSFLKAAYLNMDHNRIKLIDKNFFAFYLSEVRSIDLSWNLIEELDQEVFKRLKTLDTINLSHNKIEAFDSARYFKDLEALSKLDLSYNQIQSIHKDLLKEQTQLTSVFFNSNKLQSLPLGFFNHATALKSINLSNNLIESLDNSIFTNQYHLESLDLSSNKIKSLRFLANLFTLKSLNVASNLVEELEKESLVSLPMLQDLNLRRNKISRLGAGIFDELSNLKTLCLNENCIEEIDQESFCALIQMENLNLGANSLKEIDAKWFGSLKSLKNLVLENNRSAIFKTNEACIVSLASKQTSLVLLENLVISGVDLSSSFNSFFFKPRNEADFCMAIKTLDLSDCSLEDLYEGSFSSLVYLVDLRLARNKLKSLNNRTFEGLRRLETLDLSEAFVDEAFDKLVSDEIRLFDVLENLDELRLLGNHIRLLNGLIFNNLKKLTLLDLERNMLTDQSLTELGNPFENLTRLTNLDLGKNGLECLCHSWLGRLQALEYFSLAQNKISSLQTQDSDQELKSSAFFYNNRLKHLCLSGNNLTKIRKENFKNLKILDELDLSSNKIETLDECEFDELGKCLSTLDLSNNCLTQINTKTFEKLERLESLDLAENNIEKFVVDHDRNSAGDDDLRLFEDLDTLNLARNKLKELNVVGLNLDQSRSLTSLHLNDNELGDQEKLAKELSKIRTLELLDLAGNASLEKIKTSWMMLDLNRLKYLHFDGEIENDLASSPEHRDAFFFLNLFNVQRDLVFQDRRYQEPIERLKTTFPLFNHRNLYLTERAIKSFYW